VETLKLVLWFDNIAIVLKEELLDCRSGDHACANTEPFRARSKKVSDLQKTLEAAHLITAAGGRW